MTVKEVIDQIHDNELYFDIHEAKGHAIKGHAISREALIPKIIIAASTRVREFLITPKYKKSARIISGIPLIIVIYTLAIFCKIRLLLIEKIQSIIPSATARRIPKIAIIIVSFRPSISRGKYSTKLEK